MKNVLTGLWFAASYFGVLPAQSDSAFLAALEKKIQRPLPSSFFLIQATTGLTTYSNAPQILQNLNLIRRWQLCPYVVFLWKDELPVGDKHLLAYFEKYYFLKNSDKTFIVVSDSLYDVLARPGYDIQVYYFHEGRRLLSLNGKYESLPEKTLPYKLIDIESVAEFNFEDTLYFHDNLERFFPLSDSLAISISEDHFAPLRLVRIPDGKVIGFYKPPQKVVIEWIYKYLNSRKYTWDEIKRGVQILDTMRRTSFKPYHIYVKDTSIFVYCDLSAYVPNRVENRSTPTPFRDLKKFSYNKGDLIQEGNVAIVKLNKKTLATEKIYFLDVHQDNKYYKNNFIAFSEGFYYSRDTFFVFGYKYNNVKHDSYEKFFRKNRKFKFIHCFKAVGDSLLFCGKAKPRYMRNFGEVYHCALVHFFFRTPDGVFVFNEYFPEIYNLKFKKPQISWVEDPFGLKYKIPYFYDTSYAEIPFYAFRPFFILNNKILALLTIENFWNLKLSFYLPEFTKLYSVSLNEILPNNFYTRIWDMEDGHFFMTENYLYFFHCFKSSGCKLLRIKYRINPINQVALELIGSFEP